MTDILKGMRVVEGSAFVAAPLAGMTLAQMGAEVIRFDRLEGGLDHRRWPVGPSGASHFWAGLNKGKRSFAVNLKAPEGRELVSELVCAPGADAGILLTNLRVRGWMDYETLSKRRADLIMVSILGDRRGRPAVDYTVNPAAGFPDATGPEGLDAPVAHVLPAWDCICGQMAALGALAAERRRLRGGGGGHVEITVKDVAVAIAGHLGLLAEADAGIDRPKAGNALYGAYGQDFLTADGRRIMIIGLTDRQWRAILSATGAEAEMAALAARLGTDLSEEGARWRARREITAALAPWFAARRAAEIGAALEAAGATWSEFRTFREALAADPDFGEDNPVFARIAQPGLGVTPATGLPLHFHGAGDARRPRPAPALGADTEAILADVLGLPDAAIDGLFARGVVGGQRG